MGFKKIKMGRAHFGRPFVKRFALCYRSVVCPVVSCLSVCDVAVLWPNGRMDQDKTWHGGRPRPWPQCVTWGPSSPFPKAHSLPLFGNVCCVQTAGWIKMPLGTEICLGQGHMVLDGDRTQPAFTPPKGAKPPVFGPCLL